MSVQPSERKKTKQTKIPTSPKSQPWGRPVAPDSSDFTKESIFAAIGMALSAWEGFELALSLLFGLLVAPKDEPLPAQRAYGSIVTFKGRTEMVEAAAEAVFFISPNTDLERDIDDLIKWAVGFVARRNEIAHGIVTERYLAEPFSLSPKRIEFVLAPPGYSTLKTQLAQGIGLLSPVRRQPDYIYSSPQILTFRDWFVELQRRTDVLRPLVGQHPRARPWPSKPPWQSSAT